MGSATTLVFTRVVQAVANSATTSNASNRASTFIAGTIVALAAIPTSGDTFAQEPSILHCG
mgnify:CR=1 FL=1